MAEKKGSFLSKIRSKPKPKVDKDLEALIETVQEDTSDMRARLKLADAYLKRDEKLKALDQYLLVAENYAEQSFHPKAVAAFKRALEVDPQMIEVYIKLGRQYHRLGLMSEVVSNFTKAAEIHEKAGRKKEALDTFRQLAELTPDNAVSRLKMGQRYLAEGFRQDALEEFLKAADVFERQRKTPERRKLLEGLIDKGIDELKVVSPLVDIYLDAGEHNEVLALLGGLKKDITGSVALQEAIARSARAVGRRDVALESLERISRLYDISGRPDKVRETCGEIKELDPENAYALDRLERYREPEPEPEPIPEPPAVTEMEVAWEDHELEIEVETEADEGVEVELESEEPLVAERVEEIEEFDEIEPIDGLEEAATAAQQRPPDEDVPAAVEEDAWSVPAEHLDEADTGEVDIFGAEEAGLEDIEPIEGEVDLFGGEGPATPAGRAPGAEPRADRFLSVSDYRALSRVDANAYLEGLRGSARAREASGAFMEYISDLNAELPHDIPVLEMRREMAIEFDDRDAARELTEELLDAALASNEESLAAGYAESLAADADREPRLSRRLAEFFETRDAARAAASFARLGQAAAGAGDRDAACDDLSRAVALMPENIEYRRELLGALRAAGDAEGVAENAKTLAGLYLSAGDVAGAREIASHWHADQPESEAAFEQRLAVEETAGDAGAVSALLSGEAGRLLETGAPERAAELLGRALEYEPEDIGVRETLARAHRDAGDRDAAATQLVEIARIDLARGKNADAIVRLAEAAGLAPSSFAVRESIAPMLDSAGDADAAAREFAALATLAKTQDRDPAPYLERAAELRPNAPEVRRALIDHLRESGETARAIDELYRLAESRQKAGHAEDTESALREILSIDAGQARAHRQLRDHYITTGQEDKAVIELLGLAQIAHAAGDRSAERADYGEILGLDPDNVDARRKLIDLHREAGDIESAAAEMVALADALERRQDMSGAADVLSDVMNLRPGDAAAASRLKDVYIAGGRVDDAVAMLMDAAKSAEAEGRLADAAATLGEVASLSPDHLGARAKRRDLLLASGDTGAAVDELRAIAEAQRRAGQGKAYESTLKEIVRLSPADLDARERLKDHYIEGNHPKKAVSALADLIDAAFSAGDFDVARRAAEELDERSPDHEAALVAFANLAETEGRADEAVARLCRLAEGVADRQPERAREWLARASRLSPQALEPREKMRDIARAARDDVAEADALGQLAPLYVQAGRAADAATAYEMYLARRGGDEDARIALVDLLREADRGHEAAAHLLTLAELTEGRGDLFRAERYLEDALGLDAQNQDARRRLSELHLRAGDTDKALRELFELEATEEDRGKFDEAIGLLRRIREVDPKNEQAALKLVDLYEITDRPVEMENELYVLAVIYGERGDTGAAQTALRRLIALAPDNEAAHQQLTETYVAEQNIPSAVAELTRFADVLAENGRYDLAAAKLREVRVLDPENDRAAIRMADLLIQAGDTDAGLDQLLEVAEQARAAGRADFEQEALEKAAQAAPLSSDAQHSLKRLYLQIDRPDKALDVMLAFGRRLIEAGQPDVAVKALRSALENDAENIAVLGNLKDALIATGDTGGAVEMLAKMAQVARARGETDQVERRLKEMLELDRSNLESWRRLRDFYFDMRRMDAAAKTAFDALDALASSMTENEREVWLLEILAIEPAHQRALRRLVDVYKESRQTDKAARRALELADAYAAAGQGALLEPLYREILSIDAANAAAHRRLAELYRRRGEHEAAASELLVFAEIELTAGRLDELPALLRGVVDTGVQTERALTLLRKTQSLRGDRKGAMATTQKLVDLAMARDDLAVASRYLDDMLQVEPDNLTARERLAHIRLREGKTREAVADLVMVGEEAARVGDRDHALRALSAAIEADPDHVRARELLLSHYEELGRVDEQLAQIDALLGVQQAAGRAAAVETLHHKKLQLRPGDRASEDALADHYARTGETEKATLLLFGMTDNALDAGDRDRAIELLSRISAYDPENEEAHRRASAVYREAGRLGEAANELLKMVEIAAAGRRFRSAEAYLQEIFAVDPHHHEAQERLARLFMERSGREQSIRELISAGDRAVSAGRLDEARASLHKALELDPENVEAKNLLAAIYYRRPRPPRRDVPEYFEDVETAYADVGDIDIAWTSGEE
ncbi:tetratricopeptide repeat protein, partial [bacterium]|nr:tetratricopeptide repeat protein [bacterium]